MTDVVSVVMTIESHLICYVQHVLWVLEAVRTRPMPAALLHHN